MKNKSDGLIPAKYDFKGGDELEAALLVSEDERQLHLNQLMKLVMNRCTDCEDNGEYQSRRVPFADASVQKAWIDMIKFDKKQDIVGYGEALVASVTRGEWEETSRTQDCIHYLILEDPKEDRLEVFRTNCSGQLDCATPVLGASRLHRHDMQPAGSPMYSELNEVEDYEIRALIIALGETTIIGERPAA